MMPLIPGRGPTERVTGPNCRVSRSYLSISCIATAEVTGGIRLGLMVPRSSDGLLTNWPSTPSARAIASP